MAAVNITISGVLCDKYGRTIRPVTLVGEASITGLGVGGGPIIPPEGGGDDRPPVIWGGGNEPFPTPPIANVPPISNPDPPTNPPDDNGFVKPPPPDGGWSYHESYGWGFYPAGGGKPQPPG